MKEAPKPQRARMALTLSAGVADALHELGEAINKPAATVAAELLSDMEDQLRDLAKIARAAKSGNKAAAKRALQHMVGDGMAEIIGSQQPDLFPKPRKSPR